jgi:hypothetical protein
VPKESGRLIRGQMVVRIHHPRLDSIAESSNGRTTAFEPVCVGSTPASATSVNAECEYMVIQFNSETRHKRRGTLFDFVTDICSLSVMAAQRKVHLSNFRPTRNAPKDYTPVKP